MGVDGSSKLLGQGVTFEPKGKNKGGNDMIAIDASQLVFQLAKGHCSTSEIIRNYEGKTMTACFKILQFILHWLNKYVIESHRSGNGCIAPVFVFDGHASSSKRQTIKKRKDKQGTALKKLDVIIEKIKFEKETDTANNTDQTIALGEDNETMIIEETDDVMDGYTDLLDHSDTCVLHNRERAKNSLNNTIDYATKEQYTKHLRNSYNPSSEIAYIKLMLKWMGIPYLESPHEGDAQCAAFGIKYGAGTITGDIDILLMGGNSIYKFRNIRNLILEEYKLETVIETIQNRIIRIIKLCDADKTYNYGLNYDDYRDNTDNIDVTIDLVDLRAICCLLGTDYCPGLKIDRSKIDLDAVLLLYIQNGRNLRKVLHEVRDNRHIVINQMTRLGIMKTDRLKDPSKYPKISDQYIDRMIKAYKQYDSEKVHNPSRDIININKPDILQLIGFCSSFMSKESIDRAVKIVNKAHVVFKSYLDNDSVNEGGQSISQTTSQTTSRSDPVLVSNAIQTPNRNLFSNFGSYHRRCDRIVRETKRDNEDGDGDRSRLGIPYQASRNTHVYSAHKEKLTDIQPRYVGYSESNSTCVCQK